MAERVPTALTADQKATGLTADEEPTIGKLVSDVSKDVSTLISKEIELAKSELKLNVRFGGIGAALFGAAAFLLLLAVIILSVAFGFFLHFTGLKLAWCFLIVFGVYVLIAAILILFGIRSVKKVKGLPKTMEQLQETRSVLKKA